MKKLLIYLSLFGVLIINSSSIPKEKWENLIDKNLSKWEIFQSYYHQLDYNGHTPKDKNGKDIEPIGYNKNVSNVFSVIEEKNNPILRVSGEIYGCVFTKQEFRNYHLKVMFKWGDKKWTPRLNEDMDSGILYHSQGKAGVDYWKSWILSQEFQVIENSCGDYWPIGSSAVDIRASKPDGKKDYVFDKNGEKISFGAGKDYFCQAKPHKEKPNGEWNTLELICYEGKSLHIVNGELVMALSNSRYKSGDKFLPLDYGKLQIQSEAAEVFYKNMLIKKIDALPKKYLSYF